MKGYPMNQLMLYIHIPFCEQKCLYCDFLSGKSTQQQRQEYVDALCREITLHTEKGKNHKIPSIFFGGGTPSILTTEQITQVMDTIHTVFPNIEKTAEITLELNPGTADIGKIQTYKNIGINRLSIGLQATNNQELKILGRIHTYETFLETYNLAREQGFCNINIDLMSAIPGQTLETWRDTLSKIIALQPEHISAYSLIVEEGTPFNGIYGEGKSREHLLPVEEVERQMYYSTKERLRKAGYHRYEVSNYAQNNSLCKHNQGYWNRIPYLGLGLGASSLIKEDNSQEYRWKNLSEINEYIEMLSENRSPIDEKEEITIEMAAEEYIFLGLRNMKGISVSQYRHKFEKDIHTVHGEVLQKMYAQNLLIEKDDRILFTEKGIDLSNYVLSNFL